MTNTTTSAINSIKGGLLAALRAHAIAGPLKGQARVRMSFADQSGDVLRAVRVSCDAGVLCVGGFFVVDPDGQAVNGDETELTVTDLRALPVETLQQIVEYFGADKPPPVNKALKRAIRRYVSTFSFLNKGDFPLRPRQIDWRGRWMAAEDQKSLVEDILKFEVERAQKSGTPQAEVAHEIELLCEPQPGTVTGKAEGKGK